MFVCFYFILCYYLFSFVIIHFYYEIEQEKKVGIDELRRMYRRSLYIGRIYSVKKIFAIKRQFVHALKSI